MASASHTQKGGGKGKPKPICRDFLTDSGCQKGGQCLYQHPNTVGRCLRCGSTKHVVADCKRPRRDPSANTNKGKGRSTFGKLLFCDRIRYKTHQTSRSFILGHSSGWSFFQRRKDKHLGFKFWGFTRTNPNMQKQCHTKVLGSGDGQQVLSNFARITPSRWSTPPETTSTLYGGILDGLYSAWGFDKTSHEQFEFRTTSRTADASLPRRVSTTKATSRHRRPPGDPRKSLWADFGNDVETMWERCGNNVETMWKRCFASVVGPPRISPILHRHTSPPARGSEAALPQAQPTR